MIRNRVTYSIALRYCGEVGGGVVAFGAVLPGLLGFGLLVGGFVLPVGG
jgi:hypothetical protein